MSLKGGREGMSAGSRGLVELEARRRQGTTQVPRGGPAEPGVRRSPQREGPSGVWWVRRWDTKFKGKSQSKPGAQST